MRDLTRPSIIVPSVGYIVLLFIASRIYTRLVMVPGNKLGWDDWTILVLGAVMVAVNAGSILRKYIYRMLEDTRNGYPNKSIVGQAGLGKDIWTLEFDKITEILKVRHDMETTELTGLIAVHRFTTSRSSSMSPPSLLPKSAFSSSTYASSPTRGFAGLSIQLLSWWFATALPFFSPLSFNARRFLLIGRAGMGSMKGHAWIRIGWS